MPAPRRIQSLRREHEKMLHLAGTIEKMLELASKNIFAEHLKGLQGLRALESGLANIERHCHAEALTLESTYRHSLQEGERARIDAEHQRIILAVTNFREELKCATPDRTMAMILPGMDLVNQLRAHIAYEREMLGRIGPSSNAQRAIEMNRQKGKSTLGRKSKHMHKRKIRVKKAYTPYTLEPHPEL